MRSRVTIRRAVLSDAATIARHRVRMFEDMGLTTPDMLDDLRVISEAALARAIDEGVYLGWLVEVDGTIVAGAGVLLRQVLPHPLKHGDGRVVAAGGRHAEILNVYTEPESRRRGLAERLVREILDWARAERPDRLTLHASEMGRPLYERLGFTPTNEMRFSGELSGSR